ncbi:MAG: hypothetical protein ABI162_03535 [Luteolibacter sp.]
MKKRAGDRKGNAKDNPDDEKKNRKAEKFAHKTMLAQRGAMANGIFVDVGILSLWSGSVDSMAECNRNRPFAIVRRDWSLAALCKYLSINNRGGG